MMRKLISIILLSIFTISITACDNSSVQVSYYKESGNNKQDSILQSDMGIAEFMASNLTVIPNDGDDKSTIVDDVNITATSSLLINKTDNEAIYSDDIYHKMYPASLTKLITALVVLEQGDLDDMVTISENAGNIGVPGAILIGFEEGDQVNLEALLNIFLVYSGNDAGIALAEHISGSEELFAIEMNKAAKRLGAVHSNFVNSHGLHDDNHYTTAYDLYLVFNELLSYEEFKSIIKKPSITFDYMKADASTSSQEFTNTNRYLLGYAAAPDNITVVGGKTGTTRQAGNCLILYSHDGNNNEYISLILEANGRNSLYDQMTYLLGLIE